jgi:iron complex outermembrane receptor protein
VEGGSFGYLSAAGRISQVSSLTSHLSASFTRSDGYQRSKAGALNSDYRGGKAFYQGAYESDQVRLNWHAGLSTKGFGSNTFYSAKYDEQYEKTTKLFTAIQAETAGPLHLKPAVYWNSTHDRFELIRGSEAKVPFNHHRTDVFGININSWFDWQLGRTAVGAEFRNEDIVSSNLGEPLQSLQAVKSQEPTSNSPKYKYGLNRSQLSFHAEHNILLKRLTISAGFIAIKNTGNEMDFKVYPGVDASLRLNRSWKLFASYNESLRMPSFTELYYSVGGHKADKNLKPEEMRAVEGGVKMEDVKWTVVGKVFYHHCHNIIDWVMDTRDPEGTWQSVNHTKVNTLGEELSLNFPLSTFNFHLAYCHLHQQKDEEPYLQSQYSLEYLRHKLTAMLQWHVNSRLSTTLNYRYQDRTGSYTSTEGIVMDYRPYSIVDARITWKLPQTECYVEANNLTSTHYIDYGNVPQPGCWITVGCKKTLNYKKRMGVFQ